MDTLLPGLTSALDLHPLFVHFPLALWLAAALLIPLASIRDDERLAYAGRLLLWLGTAAAAVTVGTGFLAANRMGHDAPGHEFVHVHRNFMLTATAVAAFASVVAWRVRARRGKAAMLLTALMITLAVITTLGADRGAHLVFGYGMGVSEAPPTGAGGEHGATGHDHGGHAH